MSDSEDLDADLEEVELALQAAGRSEPIAAHMAKHRARARLGQATKEDAKIGRFVVLGRIGSGSFGVVYSAHDPELQRNVALKVVASGAAMEPEDLLAEARALAKIRHPNVITVHEVGRVEGREDAVFFAMEHVEGGTVEDWLAERPRSVGELLRMFRAAGRGLAAVHQAGVVHRDFKPSNVLVGADGHPRLGDFGLATRLGVGSGAAGTQRYMAPELASGGPASPRSDIYAFCVALAEALCAASLPLRQTSGGDGGGGGAQTNPTGVQNGRDLREAITAAPIHRSLKHRIAAGLDPDPSRRPGSMGALVEAMGRRAPARVAWVAGTVGVALAVTALAFARIDSGPRCSLSHDMAREQVERGGRGSDAIASASPVVAAWERRHDELCAAPKTARAVAAADFCLRTDLELVRVLGELEVATHDRYVAPGLAEDVERGVLCGVGNRGEVPVWTAAVADAASALARARVAFRVGARDEHDKEALVAERHARAAGVDGLIALALLERGRFLYDVSPDEGIALATEAVKLAEPLGLVDAALQARMRLVWLIGDRQGAPRQARVWAQNAELLLSQSRQAPQFRLWLAVALARLDRLSGDPATGLTRVETALTEAAREPTVTAAERQSALREQAEAHLALGDYPAADSVARRALAEAKAIDAPHARFVRRAEQLLQRVQSEQ